MVNSLIEWYRPRGAAAADDLAAAAVAVAFDACAPVLISRS